MIYLTTGKPGSAKTFCSVASQLVGPNYLLQDFDGLYFRGFMFGRPVVGDQRFALRYSHKVAVRLAEKFAKMYGANFVVVGMSATAGGGKRSAPPAVALSGCVSNLPVGNHGDNNL